MPKPRFALVTAAWMIGSPAPNELVAACAPGEGRDAQFAALLAHLRGHAAPLQAPLQ